MKQVLIYSIQPEHVLNILNGLKTVEVRRRDLPQWAKDKLARGEIVEGYGYCTKGKPYLYAFNGTYIIDGTDKGSWGNVLNGLVVVKFEVSGTTRYVDCSGCTNTENGYECENDFMYLLSVDPILRKATCLEADEIEEYGNGADLYAHHLTNIQPIEPMGIEEFYGDFAYSDTDEYGRQHAPIHIPIPLKRAPQSFQSAWVKGE